MGLGKEYITNLDNYIKSNIKNITCKEISELYFDFVESIHMFGLSNFNVTGLTEYLFYRSFIHINKSIIDRDDLIIQRKVEGTKRQPDLVIYREKEPILSIEVKSNYANIDEDYGRHHEVVILYPNIVTCTVAFCVNNKNNKQKIMNYSSTSDFYNCMILNDSNERLVDAMKKVNLVLF
ncbi:hypothetical protein [Paenibacillus pini]|uniref:Uncharacterized protein n=1 Tax=Paenibacillus pini JCM 16418 TaxID=1236976 RepID=W7Z8P4_9BACL|nr:hypothetical protein [Paenibacillus pini]GAF10809.1 hypothetical protein JCM16418_5031 [Paenibacillus pini JCM 16418]